MSTADVTISVLGPMELVVSGQRVPVGGPHARTVLAVLLLGGGAVMPIGRLVDAIWADSPPRSAVAKVQGHVCALRKALHMAGGPTASAFLVTRPPGYQLITDCRSDLREFATLTERAAGLHARSAGLPHAEMVSDLLGRALRCWRGAAFVDVPGDEVRDHGHRLDQLRSIAAEDKAANDLRLGRFRTVLEELGPVLLADPLRERARELLIHTYLRLGQRHAALACYEAGRRRLRDELGISPGPALQRLAQAIRTGTEPAPPAR